jgi:hypothetical protein
MTTDTTLPDPLTPIDCDLRDFLRMPLEVGRLLTSTTWIEAAKAPRIGHALMSMWCAAWHQVPAGSLENNEATLHRLSMCPTDKEWRAVRPALMRGWVLCSDGRLYHPVVCELALEGLLEKLAARKSSGAGNAKRHSGEFDPAPLEMRMEVIREQLRKLNPASKALQRKRTAKPPDGVPPGSRRERNGIPSGSQEKRREGITPQPPDATACGQLGITAHDGRPYPHSPDGWPSTRPGVEAIGEHLGLGRWDERASQLGAGEPFGLYEAQVRHAAGWPPAEQRSTTGAVPALQALRVV